jgi:hypothetical protein
MEFPCGCLTRVEHHFGNYWDHAGDRPAGSRKYTVELVMDRIGDRLLNGPATG